MCSFFLLTQLNVEAVVHRCPVTKVFLEISQNSQENFVNFAKFLSTRFLIEIPLVAASVNVLSLNVYAET